MEDGRANPGDWRSCLRDTSPWYRAFANGGDGADYIETAFRLARQADPNAILYYNDYNLDSQNKAQAVANMVKEINDKYLAEGNDRLLIEGVGMQGHYRVDTGIINVEDSLKMFIALGVEVSVTELDVTVSSGGAITEDAELKQAIKYAELMALYKKYSDHIARVTFWGLDDASSWRSTQFPLLFNADYTPKQAYYAVLDPEAFLEEHGGGTTDTSAQRGTAAYGTPALDAENLDPLWTSTEKLPIDRMLQAWNTATGTARVLWDENNVYVLFEVNDTVLDSSSSVVHEVDSVEAFVDFTNCKKGTYAKCDGQYRVSFENVSSFNPAARSEGFESNSFVDGVNYRVVMKIPYLEEQPELGKVIGFDAQVNDAQDGSRAGIAKWCDPTDDSWQSTSKWGELELVAAGEVVEETASAQEGGSEPAVAQPAADDGGSEESSSPVLAIVCAAIVLLCGITVLVFVKRRKKVDD
jgi:endo-1,4-beta-xylanase